MGKSLYIKDIMSKTEIQEMIDTSIRIAAKQIAQEVYREISASLISAGERDLYNYDSIEEQCAKLGCAMAGDRIRWMVEEETQQGLL